MTAPLTISTPLELNHVMLAAAIQAFKDLFTPPFRAVLLKCVGLTIGLLALLIILLEGLFGHFVDWPAWIETTVEWLGGLALVVGSIFLIPPATSLMAGLYLDDIAKEVERVYYPSDPPGKELPTLAAIGVGLKFCLVVLLVNLVALFLLLVPGINLIAFYIGNGYLLGREYFEMVAMRHMPPEEARGLRMANMGYVTLCGLIIAGLASVPILNLLTPLFATAFMVHVYKSLARRAGLSHFGPRDEERHRHVANHIFPQSSGVGLDLIALSKSFDGLHQRDIRILQAISLQFIRIRHELLSIDNHFATGAVIITAYPRGDKLGISDFVGRKLPAGYLGNVERDLRVRP